MPINLKLRQLEGFRAAARHSSFSLAARELAMTQPSFSQLIRELETALNVKLFDRTTRRVQLTEAGQRLAAMIDRPLDDLEDAYKVMREMAAGTRGRVVCAALPSVAFGVVTLTLARFKARHPHTTVRLLEDPNVTLIDRVMNREVDFGIGTLTTPTEGLTFRELLKDELLAVYPLGHAFAHKSRVSWWDLSEETLILLSRESSVREVVERGFAASGLRCEPEYEIANMVTSLGMVRTGLGVTVMPRTAVQELSSKGVRWSRIGNPRPVRQIGIITRADRRLTPAAASFVDLLFAAARAKMPR